MLLSFNFDLITKCLNLSFDCFLDVEAEVSSGGKFLEAINNFLSYLLMDLCFFIDFWTRSQYSWAVLYENFWRIGNSFSLL